MHIVTANIRQKVRFVAYGDCSNEAARHSAVEVGVPLAIRDGVGGARLARVADEVEGE